jgi:hypothetical protein
LKKIDLHRSETSKKGQNVGETSSFFAHKAGNSASPQVPEIAGGRAQMLVTTLLPGDNITTGCRAEMGSQPLLPIQRSCAMAIAAVSPSYLFYMHKHQVPRADG